MKVKLDARNEQAVLYIFVIAFNCRRRAGIHSGSSGFDYEQVDVTDSGTDYNHGVAKISHEGGDSMSDQELYIRGSGFNQSGSKTTTDDPKISDGTTTVQAYVDNEAGVDVDMINSGLWNGTKSGDEAVVSGDFANVYVQSDYELNVVYQSQEGSSSSTLAEDSGPDA